jgi:hypothetical protein
MLGAMRRKKTKKFDAPIPPSPNFFQKDLVDNKKMGYLRSRIWQ